MSTGKRLAKRSILGTRVVAPGDEGLYQPGVIQAVKTAENSDVPSRYSVRFDLTRKVREYSESDIIGPGFAGVTGIKLRPGQIVYVTYCNREMQGSVVCHRPNIDQVIVRLLVSFSLFNTSEWILPYTLVLSRETQIVPLVWIVLENPDKNSW